MTVGVLRTLLVVAAWDTGDGLSYDYVANKGDQEYIQALHHIELLSTGRRGHVGPELLVRQEVKDSRAKRVTLSAKGRDLARHFAYSDRDHPDFAHIAHQLKHGPLAALRDITQRLPGVSLGSLTVFLQVGMVQKEFGFDGTPVKRFTETLDISNMPRHLGLLGDGLKKRVPAKRESSSRVRTAPEILPGYEVIKLVTSLDDGRIKLPEVTPKGHAILTALASALFDEQAEIAKRVKPEILKTIKSPEDIDDLDDSAFEDLVEYPEQLEDDNDRGFSP